MKKKHISHSPKLIESSLWLFTHITQSPNDYDKVTSFYVTMIELESSLDEYGCWEDYNDVLRLSIGETLSYGFAQGNVPGLIVTRILGKHREM